MTREKVYVEDLVQVWAGYCMLMSKHVDSIRSGNSRWKELLDESFTFSICVLALRNTIEFTKLVAFQLIEP